MGKIDFDRINSAALSRYPDILHQWLPGGRMEGHEYRCADLTGGSGSSLGVNTNSGKWSDFATGQSGGDPVSLYAAIFFQGEQGAAAKALADSVGVGTPAPNPNPAKVKKQKQKQSQKEDFHNIIPVPQDAGEPPAKHYRLGEPSARWPYLDAQCRLLGFVCRFDLPGGGKEVVPLIYGEGQTSGRRQWRWQSFCKPRPMYGLDRLAARPDANVVVVEGEKCADALQSAMPEIVAVSWPGGGKAVKHVDFSPLAGRKAVFWPDFDAKPYPDNHRLAGQMIPWHEQPGPSAMMSIIREIGDRLSGVRIVPHHPGESADGWDCADAVAEGWDADRLRKFMQGRMVDPADPGISAPPPAEDHPHHAEDDAPVEYLAEGDFCLTDLAGPDVPFQCLGYDHGTYFYLPRGTRQVEALRAGDHSQKRLLVLAPLQWWERNYPGRSGPAWGAAANALFRHQEAMGVYDPSKVRGRGAWEDDGRSVLHLGDYMMVDGKRTDIHRMESRYVYEAAAAMDQGVDAEPLPAKRAHHLAEYCKLLSWEKPINAMLMVGWCVVAPICGALRWRPHIWITGSGGSGKSWVMSNILRPIVGPAALMVQGNTSEAGLRQSLKFDARPVLFDEAEGEDREGQARIKTILELMRQASTETGAVILKGSTNGQVSQFQIRSCFAMSSIGVGLQQYADVSRISILSLVKNEAPTAREDFEEICKIGAGLITPEFCAALRARSVSMIPVIRRNAEVFARAAADVLQNQRAGDQIGALLAGAYSLYKSTEVTAAEARQWVEKQDWSEQRAQEEHRDEDRCLSAILETVVRVAGERSSQDLTIAELIEMSVRGRLSADISPTLASDALARHGIRVERDGFIIANTHWGIEKMLRDTPWSVGWGRVISRIRGATSTANSVRFAGTKSRGVQLPLHHVLDDVQEKLAM